MKTFFLIKKKSKLLYQTSVTRYMNEHKVTVSRLSRVTHNLIDLPKKEANKEYKYSFMQKR